MTDLRKKLGGIKETAKRITEEQKPILEKLPDEPNLGSKIEALIAASLVPKLAKRIAELQKLADEPNLGYCSTCPPERKTETQLCEHGYCRTCQCPKYCWID